MKNIGFLFKAKDDALFKIKPKRPAYVLNPLKAMLNLFVDRISLKQLDYKMEWNDLPNDYNFFQIGYCYHPAFSYAHIQLEQANKLIPSLFQEEDHPFIYDTFNNKRTKLVCSYFFTALRKRI